MSDLSKAADLLDLYARLRSEYITPAARVPGGYNDPSTSRSDQDMLIEVGAYATAARILRYPHDEPLGCPTWLLDEWTRGVRDILGEPPLLAGPRGWRRDYTAEDREAWRVEIQQAKRTMSKSEFAQWLNRKLNSAGPDLQPNEAL